MEMPIIGEKIVLDSIKHDQSLHRRWLENIVLYKDEHIVVGFNHHTIVHEPNKLEWRTEYPAIFYFDRRYWFNIVLILSNQPFYYCNLSSPFYFEEGILQYIDYDLDVIVQLDGNYKIVDEKEYKENCHYYHYPQEVQYHIETHLEVLLKWIEQGNNFFRKEVRDFYYHLYEQY